MNSKTRPATRKTARRTARLNYFEAIEARILMTGTIAGWSAQGLTGVTASPLASATADLASLQSAPTLNRDTGLTGTSLTRGFASSGWPLNGGPVNGAATTTDLYTTLTVKSGVSLSLSELDLDYRATSTGPKNAELDYSINGGAYNVITTAMGGAGFTTTSTFQTIAPIDLSAVAALQNIAPGSTLTLRIVGYGGTGASGTLAVYNNNNANLDLAILGSSQAVATAAQNITLDSATASVTEGAAATITVDRLPATGNDLSGTVTVPYTLTDGSAILGTNYGAAGQSTGFITLNPGDSSGTITINTDAVYPQGGNKTFTVTLGAPTITGQTDGVTVDTSAPTAAAVTIVDNSETVNLSSASYTVNDSAGNAVLSLLRTGYSGDPLTVNYSITGAVNTSGAASFAAGASVAAFTVAIPDVSGNQAFNVTISSPGSAGASLGALTTATDTIVDAAAITNTLTGTNNSGVAETFTTDIEIAGPFSSTFANVVGDKTVGSFGFLAFEVLEFSPTLAPTLYPPAGSTLSGIQSLSLQLYNTATTGAFGGQVGNFNVYFIPNSDADSPTSSLAFNTADPTGLNGQAGTSSATLLGTFSFDNNTGYDTFTAANLPPAVAAAITSALNTGLSFRLAVTPTATGVGAIAADWEGGFTSNAPILSLATTQTAETFKLDASSATVSKDAGTVTITVDRSSTSDLGDAAAIHYTLTPGTAVAGADYSDGPAAGTVTFAAGDSQASFTLSILDYDAISADKTFTITLSAPSTGDSARLALLGSPVSETITIHDPRTVTVAANSNFSENATVLPAGPSTATTGVSALGVEGAGSGSFASFGVIDFNDPADPNPAELFSLPSQVGVINGITLDTANFPASFEAAGTLDVYVVTDTAASIANDGSSTLTFNTADDPTEGLGDQLGNKYLLGQITFNPAQPGSPAFTAFALTTLDPTGLSILAAALNSNAKFRIAITPESNSVAVRWEGSFDAAGPDNSLIDVSPMLAFNYTPAGALGEIGFPQTNYTANEADGVATIIVHRSGATSGIATVDYSTTDGTAAAGTDYTPVSGTLTFQDGAAAATFTIPLIDLSTNAGTKTLNITLSNPSNSTLDTQSTATLTITDNQAVSATAPTVTGTTVGDGTNQRSAVQSFTVTFNEAVNFSSTSFSVLQQNLNADGTLSGASTNVTSGFTAASTDGGFTWTISVTPGGAMDRSTTGILKDGVYQVVLHGDSISDAATGAANFNSGADQILGFNSVEAGGPSNFFHALYGDTDGNGVVNGNDLRKFEAASGASVGDSNYVSALDFDGNGVINGNDLRKFEANSGASFTY